MATKVIAGDIPRTIVDPPPGAPGTGGSTAPNAPFTPPGHDPHGAAGPADEPSSSSEALPRVEGYEVIGRLGEGGMGTVWRAVQLSTRREVALKLMSPACFASSRARVRFDREVELTAR